MSVSLVDDGPGDPKELGDEIREGGRSSWRVRRQDEGTKEVVQARLADRWSSWRVWRQEEGTKEAVQARLAGARLADRWSSWRVRR